VLDKDSGKVIRKIGGVAGRGDAEFYKPSYVTVDAEGNLYVNDAFNFRMQVFDPEGNFVKKFGKGGDTLGTFARPKGIAIDREQHLYAVDTAFENVQIFDINSTDLLLFFGGFETGPGSMHMPHGIHIDYENTEYFQKLVDKNFKIKYLVYVGNTLGYRKINVYGFGDWIGAPLPKMRKK
jgi:DNA-binding beta-propeller fold protein YncE